MRVPVRLLFVLLVALAFVAPAAAQGDPVVGDAAELLPEAIAFGEGWTTSRTAALEMDPVLFREAAVAVFAGPSGARVVVAVLLVTRDQVAVRRAWEAAVGLYDNFSGELEYITGREDELAGEPPPEGCAEAKRIDGTARQLGIDTGIPMGITLCAVEPDAIVLAVVSGAALELTGFAASDAVASLVVTTEPTAAAEP